MELLVTFVSYYVQLLAIMNPFSALPTFVALTSGLDAATRKRILKRAYVAMLILVAAFATIGNLILMAFNISIASLRIGGGVILMTLAIDMLGEAPRTKSMDPRDIAVVPIATPLIVGPGTMTTLLLLTSLPSISNTLLVLGAGFLAATTSVLILELSEELVRLLRMSTVRAIGRFMALIIAGVAADMIAKGVEAYYAQMLGSRG
ncbi:MAG: MarC family protein [Desulfurococcaceae archaeon]